MGAATFLIGTDVEAAVSTSLISTSYFYHCNAPSTLTTCVDSIVATICSGQQCASPPGQLVSCFAVHLGHIVAKEDTYYFSTVFRLVREWVIRLRDSLLSPHLSARAISKDSTSVSIGLLSAQRYLSPNDEQFSRETKWTLQRRVWLVERRASPDYDN